MLKIYSQTQNGRIFKCPNCSKIHFEFNNLNLNFDNMDEFKHTANYFLKLDGVYWEKQNTNSYFTRKILVPIGHHNFHIMLNNEELMELKELFRLKHKTKEIPIDVSKLVFCSN